MQRVGRNSEAYCAAYRSSADYASLIRLTGYGPYIMGLWTEKNLPALFVGAGLGAIIAHQLDPAPFVWLIGSVIGIAIAIPIWTYIDRDKPRKHD